MNEYLKLFSNKGFSALFTTHFLNKVYEGYLSVLLVYFAMKISSTENMLAEELSTLALMATLPNVVFLFFSGALADRYNKKTLFIIYQLIILAASSFYFFSELSGGVGKYQVMMFLFILGALFALSGPACKSYVLPILKGDKEVVSLSEMKIANSIMLATYWGSYSVGAGIAGAIIKAFPNSSHYIMLFLAIAAFIATFLLPSVPSSQQKKTNIINGVWLSIKDGAINTVKIPSLGRYITNYAVYAWGWRGLVNVLLPFMLTKMYGEPFSIALYGQLMIAAGAVEMMTNLLMGKSSVSVEKIEKWWFGTNLLFLLSVCSYIFIAQTGIKFLPLFFITAMAVGVASAMYDFLLYLKISYECNKDETSPKEMGSIISNWHGMGALGGTIGAMTTGFAISHLSLTATLISFAIGVLLFMFPFKKMITKKEPIINYEL